MDNSNDIYPDQWFDHIRESDMKIDLVEMDNATLEEFAKKSQSPPRHTPYEEMKNIFAETEALPLDEDCSIDDF